MIQKLEILGASEFTATLNLIFFFLSLVWCLFCFVWGFFLLLLLFLELLCAGWSCPQNNLDLSKLRQCSQVALCNRCYLDAATGFTASYTV